jgi:hypothetical protein
MKKETGIMNNISKAKTVAINIKNINNPWVHVILNNSIDWLKISPKSTDCAFLILILISWNVIIVFFLQLY